MLAELASAKVSHYSRAKKVTLKICVCFLCHGVLGFFFVLCSVREAATFNQTLALPLPLMPLDLEA